ARDRCGLPGRRMRGDRRQRQQVVDLLIGRRLDTGGGRELAAPHRDLFRDVAHVASLPCAEMSLTTDELIDRGMATAVYAAEAPDRMAVISPYGERTFRELNERTNQL